MEDKIMNTVEEVMENNDAMTEVCKTGKNAGLIGTVVTVVAVAVCATVFGCKKWKKRKAEKNHITVEVNTAETVSEKELEG